MLTVYGIKNCDTVKKALKWLEAEGIEHTFHDFRADGLSAADVGRWCAVLGWESLINRRSTTWRELSEDDKQGLDENKAVALMSAHPTLIKRPVFVANDLVLNGFSQDVRDKLLALP